MTTQTVPNRSLGQALRVFSAYTCVVGLSFVVTNPFRDIMIANANCRDYQTPATLVVDAQQPQPAAAICTLAMDTPESGLMGLN